MSDLSQSSLPSKVPSNDLSAFMLKDTNMLKNAKFIVAGLLLATTFNAYAVTTVANSAPSVNAANATNTTNATQPVAITDKDGKPTLAAQLQPTENALSAANQQLLSRNAQLQRQVNDLQTQADVLVYESKGQLFLYGAFTVLISLLVGVFISWLVFVRRERW